VAAAEATFANLANQKDVQRALIRQAEATIEATTADLQRYALEAARQRDLLKTRIAGTPQLVEQAEDNEKRTAAQLLLNRAQLDPGSRSLGMQGRSQSGQLIDIT
jgi:membrane fusion protein, multidrug efflux system